MSFPSYKLFGACLLSLSVVACASNRSSADTAPPPASPEPSTQEISSFSIDLPNLDGEDIEVRATNEKEIFVLAFWKTTCTPCMAQLSEFETVHQELRDKGVRIYGINVDNPDTQGQVRTWVQQKSFTFETLMDTETEIYGLYNPKGDCPFYVVVNAQGEVIRNHAGYVKGEGKELSAFLESQLQS